MRTYKIYGADGGSPTNNLANVSVQKTGRIRNLRWSVRADLDADLEVAIFELSMSSAHQATTNDTPAVIDKVQLALNFTTSGASMGAQNITRENMDFPVAGGEKIYLHTTGAGTPSMTGTCFIDVEEK